MQVFRIMSLPDKIIAFDSLPKRLLEGFELCRADGFPRHWKEYLGKIKKVIKVPPEKDYLTGQVRYFDPIIEEDAYFYLVDKSVNSSSEKWKDVCDFVRRVVDKDVRLAENIEDMAIPLAGNKMEGITIEPEDVTIIPIPKEFQETEEVKKVEEVKKENVLKCDEKGCQAEFEGTYARNSLRMHKMKKHKKEAVVA